MTNRRQFVACIILWTILATTACSAPPRAPNLGGLHSELAQNEDPRRNPVILIPGILGSKLVDRQSDVIVWGTFGFGNANPNNAEGARLVALPMARAKKLSELHDNVIPTETLDKVAYSNWGVRTVRYKRQNIQKNRGRGCAQAGKNRIAAFHSMIITA